MEVIYFIVIFLNNYEILFIGYDTL
jgi:hypothetical protein